MRRVLYIHNSFSIRLMLIAIIISALVLSCSPKKMMVREMGAMVETGMDTLEQDDDLDMLAKALPANIKLLEAMLANSPRDERLLVLLSRLYGSYAFLFLEENLERSQINVDESSGCLCPTDPAHWQEKLLDAYLKGADYALRALAIHHGGIEEKLKKVATVEPFLASVGVRDTAALFWYGFNLGNWVNQNSASIRAVSRAHVAEKVMRRVVQLRPDFYYGSAHLFLMTYYASRPEMLGGDLGAAQEHYQALKKVAGEEFLLADLFYARTYLVQKQDRSGYTTTMERIAAVVPKKSDYPLFNRLAQERARRYQTEVDDLFTE